MKILFGLCAIAVGFLFVRYHKWFVDTLGYSQFFEDRLGRGGTYTGWKLVGVVLILVGIYLLF